MYNELIFIFQSLLISFFALGSLWFSQEALIGFICVQSILANLCVLKQTTLFGFTATCSDAFSIGAVLGLNLLQEYYGREITRRTIWISFFLLIFYVLATHLQLAYMPCIADTMHPHYYAILAHMPRIIIASFSVYLVVQYFDTWLYAQLKTITRGKFLVPRSALSIGVSQLLDTILFSYAGLYGIIEDLWSIIFISYIIKLSAMILSMPGVWLSKKMVKLR